MGSDNLTTLVDFVTEGWQVGNACGSAPLYTLPTFPTFLEREIEIVVKVTRRNIVTRWFSDFLAS
jgi:hypothetical protein